MNRWMIGFVASLLVSAAHAADPKADKPIIGPPAAWVHPADLPADTGKPDASAIRVLLNDQQTRLLPNGAEAYSETVLKVQTAQGLSALGTISLPWKPDQGTLTVHKMRIVRDGKIIDLLAGGPGFTVLRRESGLEYAMLDGVLTAVIQPEGLQVGDMLDIATTVTNSDPALGGNSEGYAVIAPGARILHYRLRALWADSLPVRWREGEGLPPIRPHKAGGVTEVGIALDDIEPTVPPKQAPFRFALLRDVELTTLKSWNNLSALFAPLYDKAAALPPDSPLRKEIAAIAATSPDPAKRAEAALALVQDKIRYVFLGMNDGGLVPAAADTTWQRRFADCKGKTALLLALLHGLGIAAEPALVSTLLGDGLDQRLPMTAFFNHVIVRATVGGKVFWLDGTRTGDMRLADIRVPDFRFALPLRPAGAPLEPLDVPVPARPLEEYTLKVDMTGGVSRPFPFHVEEVTRGDEALGAHLRFDQMTPDVRQQTLRDYFAGQYADVEPKSYSASWNPATGEEKLVMDGLEKHDWRWSYEADHAAIGWKADFARASGPHADAPFQIDYPSYTVAHETILLPNKGIGLRNNAPDIDRTVAGVEYHRKATLEGGVFTIDTSTRAIAREFPAKDAASAQTALRELEAQQPLLGLNRDLYQSTPVELQAAIDDPQSAADYLQRAQARAMKKDMPGALADVDKAIALQPELPAAYFGRATIQEMRGTPQDGLADLQKGVAMAPAWQPGHRALADLLMRLGRNEEALAEADRAVALDRKDGRALIVRAQINRRLGHHALALADTATLTGVADPRIRFEALQIRINSLVTTGQSDKAIAEGKAAVAAYPQWDEAHVLLGATYVHLGQREEGMAEFDRAIAIKPSLEAYLTRANNRVSSDLAGKRADLAAALKLEPTNVAAKNLSLYIEFKASNFARVIADAGSMLVRDPRDGEALLYRGLAYDRTGRSADAGRDFAALRKLDEGNAAELNNLCWSKAILDTALPSALADCDAAIKLSNVAGHVDSRAFVMFRLGRYADALAVYDQALALEPKEASSLYMRGVTKHRLGKVAEGDSDIAAAKAIRPQVDRQFTEAGVAP